MSLDGFQETTFGHEGVTRTVYRRGEGPAVVVMHEIPGITPPVKRFCERVADAGFHVVLPHLFGTPNRPLSPRYNMTELARACVSREFSVLAARGTSPITSYLRALCRAEHAARGGKGVGALGMCITGNFALTLMVDDAVMAPVLSQPSLPLPVTKGLRAGLHVRDEDLVTIKRRACAGAGVLGLRFTHDRLVPGERFEALRRELGDGFEGIEIDSGPGNPHGIPQMAHSVLTNDLVDEAGHPTRAALERVLAFFEERLR